MPSKELKQLRLDIAKSYYVNNLKTTSPNEFEKLALKSFDIANVFIKVYKEVAKDKPLPESAYLKG